MDLVTHHEISINATPARIWPHIVSIDDWKKGAVLIPTGGRPHHLGERFHVIDPRNPEQIEFTAETIELSTQRRRTLRFNDPHGRLIGYASWVLTSRGQTATLVEYHVLCDITLPLVSQPTTESCPPDTESLSPEATFLEATAKRFAEELATLKALVERGG